MSRMQQRATEIINVSKDRVDNDDESDKSDDKTEYEMEIDDDNNELSKIQQRNTSERKKKRGIIYLSTIPKYMNVTKVREIFGDYGTIGRVYLQPAVPKIEEGKKAKKKKTPAQHFTEGWVEFESKKVAKHVAETLNNKQIATRKKSKFYDLMWNIKYLPRFKWVHLSERLAYERAVHKQRLRTEISQAKREANFFSYNVDRSKKLMKRNKETNDDNKVTSQTSSFQIPNIKQRDTDHEIRSRKKDNQSRDDDRTEFLKSLFS